MLHIIHGKDTFRSHLALRDLIAQQQAVDIYDSSDTTPDNVRNFIQNESLFADYKTLVIKNALSEQGIADVIQQYVDLIATHKRNTLVAYEAKDMSKNAVFKALEAQSKVDIHNQATQAQNIAFLRDYFKKHIGISDSVVVQVYNKCSEDMHLTFSELRKLSTFCVDRVATQQDVENLCLGTTEANVFATIDAIFARNKTLAFDKLQTGWANGESPELMFAMLERQLRIVVLIRSEIEHGTAQQDIAQKTQLHPFVVKKTIPLATKMPWSIVQKLYNRIQSLDSKVKQGHISPYFACELFSFAVLSM